MEKCWISEWELLLQKRKHPIQVCEWKKDKTITPQKYHKVKNHHNIVKPHFLVIHIKFWYILGSPIPLIGKQVKHLLILISFLLLSSPVIGDSHKGETLYLWETSSGKLWKYFGDKETQKVYKGDVKDGKPNGLGFLIYPNGSRYVGSWENGEWNGQGTVTVNGKKWRDGEWSNGRLIDGIMYDEDGKIGYKYVNGKRVKQ